MLTGINKSKDTTITDRHWSEETRQKDIMLGVPESQQIKVSTEIISGGRVNSIGDIFSIIIQLNLYYITLITTPVPNDVNRPRCVLQYMFTSMFDLLNDSTTMMSTRGGTNILTTNLTFHLSSIKF
jgi:hypothetical protein